MAALPAAQACRKIWEPDAPLPTLADFAPPRELLLVAATIANTCPKLMKRKVGWPSYAKYLGVGLGGAPRQTWATFNASLGARGAREMAAIFIAQHLAELSSPQQAAAADFLQRLLLTHEGVDVLIRVSLQLHTADIHTSHAMCAHFACFGPRSPSTERLRPLVHRDVYGEREGEVYGLWWAVKRLLFAILHAMIRNGMCPAPTTNGDDRHCCAPPQLRSSQCLVAFAHAPGRQERWWSLHPCKRTRTHHRRSRSRTGLTVAHPPLARRRHGLALRRVLQDRARRERLDLPALRHRSHKCRVVRHDRARVRGARRSAYAVGRLKNESANPAARERHGRDSRAASW